MKRAAACLFLVLVPAVAHAGGKVVSVSLVDRPLAELFTLLKREGCLNIVYSRERLSSGGREVTITMDVEGMEAERVLELASRAAGFSFVKEGGLYVVLPMEEKDFPRKNVPPGGTGARSRGDKRDAAAGTTTGGGKAPSPRKRRAVGFADKGVSLPGGGHYAGNFMYGQGDKVYLDLVIPEVTAREIRRIQKAMVEAVKDRRLTPEEAARLFGKGSRLRGKEIHLFLDALYRRVLLALEDGKLTDTEIHRLRNGFINTVRNAYEGM